MPAPHAVPAATPEQFVQSLIAHLFADVPLTEAQAAAAGDVISRVTAAQEQIDIRRPGGWDRLIGLNAERDAALAALLHSDTDRATFEANAAELRREQARIPGPAAAPPPDGRHDGAHAVPQASPDQEADAIAAELLRGVALTGADLEQALAIVRADVVARRAAQHERVLAIMPSNVLARGAARLPSSDQPWAAWDHDLALMAERDAAIAATLRTDAQRAAFAANAAAHRQMVYGLRRDVEGHRDRGDPGPARQA